MREEPLIYVGVLCLAGRAMLFFTHAAVMSALAHPINCAHHATTIRPAVPTAASTGIAAAQRRPAAFCAHRR